MVTTLYYSPRVPWNQVDSFYDANISLKMFRVIELTQHIAFLVFSYSGFLKLCTFVCFDGITYL